MGRSFWFGRLGGTILLSLGLVAAATSPALPQTSTGSIRGYVTDAQGAPLAEARVVAVSVLTRAQREITTQSNGFYTLLGLTPGEYDVTARQVGMAPQQIHVRVLIGEVYPLDFRLAASAIEIEAVTVVAASGVETRTSEVATNVTRQQVENLPISDRNFLDLVRLAPGTSSQSQGINDTRKTFAAGALPADNVNVFIDGASFKNDLTAGGVAGQDASRGNPFPLNAVQEFRVITQNYKAEYQKAASAIITATTKSGGSRWEGSAFFYGQGKDLIGTDSLPCTTGPSSCTPQPKPAYKRYQAGASLGGPLVRDRLFFFVAYEGNYQDRANTVAFPTNPNVQPGQFPAFDSLNLSQYQGQFVSPFRSTLLFGKLSYVLTPTQSLELSVTGRHETDIRDFGTESAFSRANNVRNDVNTAIAKHRSARGNWLNETMVSFQHYRRNPTPNDSSLIGRRFMDDIVCCPTIALLGGAASNQDYTQNRLTLRHDVTYSGAQWAGQHVIKAGASIDFAHYDIIKANNGNPEFRYFTTDSFAFPREAFMGAGNPDFTTNNRSVGAYVQDDWSPTRRLLLNLGIRWDYESDMINNDYVTPAAVRSALDTVVPSKYFTDGTQRPPFYGAFQPRVGLSYVLDEGGRWTVFGGFGVYYDRHLYDAVAIEEKYTSQHPNYNFRFFVDPADSAAGRVRWNNSYLSKQGLLALLASGQTGLPELKLIANDTKPPRSNQWSFGVRRLLGRYALSATYTGVRSNHGFTYMCHNAFRHSLPTQPPNCFGSPAAGLTGSVFLSSDAVRTWYDAVYLQAQRAYTSTSRWGAGLTYTWAKGTQIGGDLFSFDRRFPTDYAHWPSPGVQRNTIIGNWIVDVPFGVQFSGLLNLGSGTPFSTGAPQNRLFPPKQNFILGHAFAFRDIDVRLRKQVSTAGNQLADLTLEVFNVFNYQNLGCWSGTNPTCIAYGSRRLQLGAGYSF
jgi:outer membrane receptor protein involved in Fe transport